MRIFSVIILLAATTLNGYSSEKEIAEKAITLSSVLLSKNIEDDKGLAFYNLAKSLAPSSDMVMLMGGYLKKDLAPKPLPGSMAQEALLKEIKERGIYLLKRRFKRNRDVGYIAMLYLRFVEKFDESDDEVLYALCYMNTYGFTQSLDDLYDKRLVLDSVSKNGDKPKKTDHFKLPDVDSKIAEYAVRLGRVSLAKDSSSVPGLTWARLGHHLDPSDSMGLYTLRQLERNITIEVKPTKMTSDRLMGALVKRADEYVKKAKEDPLAAHLAQVYFKAADRIKPNQKEVLIGMMRLEQMDLKSSFDELLNRDLGSLVATAADDDDDDMGDDDDDDKGGDKKVAIEGSKLRPKASTLRKNLDRRDDYYYSYDYDVEERTLWGKVNNYTGHDVENITVESYIIGCDDRRREFFIAGKGIYNNVKIRTRMWYEIPKLRANMRDKGDFRYYCWLFIIKGPDGKILNYDSNKRNIKDIAKKIATFSPASLSSSSSYSCYYYGGTRFDKKGNTISGTTTIHR